MQKNRSLGIGAEVFPEGTHFRVWAPKCQKVELVLENQNSNRHSINITHNLKSEENGYFSTLIPEAKNGTLYQFRLNKESRLYPDPASRFQPQGPHGPSQVIDPSSFKWADKEWKGVPDKGRVIYEMHIGTFTQAGTWASAQQELIELSNLGITIIEMMPINEFHGNFGWGYDGVNLFAPSHNYGSPDDLRAFIDHAHMLDIAVILDVIYNHFGPEGNYIKAFSNDYFTSNKKTDWGEAINFDEPGSKEVREFYLNNAAYWIKEFHFDGLRIDATQNIYDNSIPHILTEINEVVRKSAPDRKTYQIAENEPQQPRLIQSFEEGGCEFDALWNDDFHHSAMVRLTGHHENYFIDYLGSPQEFISSAKYGFLYQGQWYAYHKKERGGPTLNFPPSKFINYIQNHDQIANFVHGLRVHALTDPGTYRVMTALLLLSPGTPLLFQGQEFASSAPFYYFADHQPEIALQVLGGRRQFFKLFPSMSTSDIQSKIPKPEEVETFKKCKLNMLERKEHPHAYALHLDLLKLRRHDSVFCSPRINGVDGAVLNPDTFVIRFFGDTEEDTRLLFVNFGMDYLLSPVPEPLLAPPKDMQWSMLWSSEDSRYGGGGTPPLSTAHHWLILGHSALVLIPNNSGETIG